MTVRKRSSITQAEVTRILKGAASAGVSMSIVLTHDEVRFVPVTATEAIEPPFAADGGRASENWE